MTNSSRFNLRDQITTAAVLLLVAMSSSAARAGEDADFKQKVLPILTKHCSDCHSADEPEADLNLLARDAVLLGARSGYIITPGKATASLLPQLLAKDSDPHMPPEGQLSDEEIQTITSWIDSLQDVTLPPRPSAIQAGDHWAFQPLVRPALPPVAADVELANEVDLFIVDKLQAAGLKLSPLADRGTLLRRATFDLTGLAPSPEAIQDFIADEAPDAYERRVDQLLASPEYGERWGRHWLDLARYADSGGYHEDIDRPHAWRYRDYVIGSLNADKPYAQFVREQLAGDEITPSNAEAVAATAFCRNGPTNDDNMGNNDIAREKYRLDLLDDVISTTSSVYLGLTIGCARCHDHKFDPIVQADYYKLLAVFNNVTRKDVSLDDQGVPHLYEKSAEKGKPALMAIVDVGRQPRETFVLFRGDLNNKGPQVQAGVPAMLHSDDLSFAVQATERSSGQRLALADWIVAKDNPLTWRVIANRLWQHHFGRGIVASASNFGLSGDKPTHPQLLDWLAAEMAEQGGSWKPLHRLMMTSTTYRQSSQYNSAAESIDPDNLLLSRMNKRRLEAEALRDSILQVAGTLNGRMGGPGVKPRIPAELLNASQRNKWPVVKREGPEHWRRSVYIYVKRQMPFPLLELFDVPSTASTCECRQDSTIPTQALVLMNDDFTQEQAQWFAQRVQREVNSADGREQARRALQLAWGHEPTTTRLEEATEFLAAQSKFHHRDKTSTDEAATLALVDLCHVLLNSNEFLYID